MRGARPPTATENAQNVAEAACLGVVLYDGVERLDVGGLSPIRVVSMFCCFAAMLPALIVSGHDLAQRRRSPSRAGPCLTREAPIPREERRGGRTPAIPTRLERPHPLPVVRSPRRPPSAGPTTVSLAVLGVAERIRTIGMTWGVMASSRARTARASSSRPVWAWHAAR